MDMDDFVPAGGGSLRGRRGYATREPVGTFTEVRTVHPDEYWRPLSEELELPRPRRTGSKQDHRKTEDARPPHGEAARIVRAALRGEDWSRRIQGRTEAIQRPRHSPSGSAAPCGWPEPGRPSRVPDRRAQVSRRSARRPRSRPRRRAGGTLRGSGRPGTCRSHRRQPEPVRARIGRSQRVLRAAEAHADEPGCGHRAATKGARQHDHARRRREGQRCL